MSPLPVWAGKIRSRGKSVKVDLTTVQRKQVASIAKKTVMKVAETKSPLDTWSQTCVDDIVYAQNLTYHIVQGDTQSTRDGVKCHIKNIYIKGKITAINNATVGNGTTLVRMLILKTDQQLTTDNTSISASTIFRGATTQNTTRSLCDLSKVSVLYDKQYVLTSDIMSANEHRPFTINQKIGKNVNFTVDAASYLKDDNYYLILIAGKTDATASNCAIVELQYAVNFKDV